MVIPATRAVRPGWSRVGGAAGRATPPHPVRGPQRGRVARRWPTWLRTCSILALPSGLRT
jgi:hypothetical protein